MKRTASLREPGQKPTGGQPGHDGHTLMAAVSPDQTLTHAVSKCAYCQASLQDVEHMGYEERLVSVRSSRRSGSKCMAHRLAEIKVPAWWEAEQKGLFPDAVTHAVQYGPTVQAWAAYFTNHHHIPVERTTEIFVDLVQHQLSDATVLKASEHLDACIVPATEAVKGLLRGAQVLHTDELGLRVLGTLHWLHVASTHGA